MKKKLLFILLIVIIFGGGFLILNSQKSAKKTAANAKLVKVIKVEAGDLETTVSADGNVKPGENKTVKAIINGVIEKTLVETGDHVQKGEKLLKFNDSILDTDLISARLKYQEAKKDHENLLDKFNKQEEKNRLELEEKQGNLEIARLNYENQKRELEQQEENLKEEINDAEQNLEKAEEELEKNEHLYQKGAVSKKAYEDSRFDFTEAERKYIKLKNDLKILVEETIPNSLELSRLKLESARNQLEIFKNSMNSELITAQDVETARLNLENAKKQLEQSRNDFESAVVKSPMAGTVIKLHVSEDDRVTTGTPLIEVADLSQYIVEAWVDEIDVNGVEEGQEVVITSDSFEGELTGTVDFVAPAGTKTGNINKYQTDIKITDHKGLIRPDMFVNAEIITNKKSDTVAVPSIAVLEGEEDSKYVYIVEDGKAVKQAVKVGLKTLSEIEVDGVKAGTKVITGPFNLLRELEEGTPVIDADSGNDDSSE